MNEAYYINQIQYFQNLVFSTEDEIRQKQLDIQHLLEVGEQHQAGIQSMQTMLQDRRNRMTRVSIDDNRVKSFAKYKNHTLDLLNGNESQQHVARKEEEQRTIHLAIDTAEQELQQLRAQMGRYEDQISQLNSQLKIERLSVNE